MGKRTSAEVALPSWCTLFQSRRKSAGTDQISCSLPPVHTLSSSVLHFILLQVFVHISSCILDTTLVCSSIKSHLLILIPSGCLFRSTIPSRSILFGPVSSWSYVFCYFVVDSFRTRCFFYCMTLLCALLLLIDSCMD